jgi:hypothetical protein
MKLIWLMMFLAIVVGIITECGSKWSITLLLLLIMRHGGPLSINLLRILVKLLTLLRLHLVEPLVPFLLRSWLLLPSLVHLTWKSKLLICAIADPQCI